MKRVSFSRLSVALFLVLATLSVGLVFALNERQVALAFADYAHVSLPYSTSGSIEYTWEEDRFLFQANEGDTISAEAQAPGDREVEIELIGPSGGVRRFDTSMSRAACQHHLHGR
jgi:hypothetical protein